MYEGSGTRILDHNQQPIKEYLPRVFLIIGGILAMVSTALAWVSIPLVGGVNLWRLYSIGSKLGELADNPAGSGFATSGFLLWSIAVLVLGVGAILSGALARSGRGVRTAGALSGGALLAMGTISILVIVLAAEEPIGMGAGEILLSLAGALVLVAAFVPAPTYPPAMAAGGYAEPERSGVGEILGRSVALTGVACLAVAVALFAVGAAAPQPEPHATKDASHRGTAGAGSGSPGSDSSGSSRQGDDAEEFRSEPGQEPSSEPRSETESQRRGPESSRENSAQRPEDVVDDYYDAVDVADYRAAWDLGGKNLNDSYDEFAQGFDTTEDVMWTSMDVTGDEVSGFLDTIETDGVSKEFEGTYTVHDGEIVDADIQPVN